MTSAASSVPDGLAPSLDPEPLSRPSREPTSRGHRRDPLGPVFLLGQRASRVGMWIGLATGLILHGAAAGTAMTHLLALGTFVQTVQRTLRDRLRSTYEVETERPPPPPPPAPEPSKVEPIEPARPQVPALPAPKALQQPVPAAAEAAKVLTSKPDPDEPLDLTGNTFVTGNGDRYVGGITTRDGTAKRAVYDPNARGAGIPQATQARPTAAAPAKDLSRSPQPVEREWNCGFPPEADLEQIDYAQVRILVTVGPDGKALSVTVLQDPGHGFGARARQCALRKRYAPGQDANGRPVTKTTPPFPVTFTR